MTPPATHTVRRPGPLTRTPRIPAVLPADSHPTRLHRTTAHHQQRASRSSHAPLPPSTPIRVLIGVVVTGAVIIAGIGFAGSYAAVRELAI
ncbi:hypothetical protein ABT090_23540, partial [Streptomyces asoensis]|uniref:hypothetical protein n=1 Tax=Streptomyces asoensis TaxID=249586 RepID=UPI00331875A7